MAGSTEVGDRPLYHEGCLRTPDSKYVKLNVGGSLYLTSMETLVKRDTMLRAMFSGRMKVLTDPDGYVLIDRNGKHFGVILDYLRDGLFALPDSKQDLQQLIAEAKYYLIPEIYDACKLAMSAMETDKGLLAKCAVPYITDAEEEQEFIVLSKYKPMIKFLCNKHNNKYSYTNNADENFLKNIELFDKLAQRFSHRIRFVKDVVGNGEICCWSFYGTGRKIAEVCCTSIMYLPEKKHVKVEFPEARIYEETLNLTLFENGSASTCSSDETLSLMLNNAASI